MAYKHSYPEGIIGGGKSLIKKANPTEVDTDYNAMQSEDYKLT